MLLEAFKGSGKTASGFAVSDPRAPVLALYDKGGRSACMTFIVEAGRDPILIPADSRGHVLIGAAQREALLDAFEQSGQSAMAFCRHHDLKYPTLVSWVKKHRRHSPPVPHGFAEVVMETAPSPPLSIAPEPLRIKLPGGTAIKIADRNQLP